MCEKLSFPDAYLAPLANSDSSAQTAHPAKSVYNIFCRNHASNENKQYKLKIY